MMGWNIGVYRQTDGGKSPAVEKSVCGERVAVWQAAPCGIRWIDDLVKAGNAISVARNGGYPNLYTAPSNYLVPTILSGPPAANKVWLREDGDSVTDAWAGKTTIDHDVIARCDPDEWLKIVVWDESQP